MKDAHAYAERSIPELYRWFAGEAAPTSPTWEAVSLWVAGTPSVAARLDALPGTKRQPNLFLAALRYLDGPLQPGRQLEDWVHARWRDIETVILRRATQTNEPGRCAVLAPVLASLPQPITLLEVGASAGLCLAPDRFRYRYTGDVDLRVAATQAAPDALELVCRVAGTPPGAVEDLRIAARAGLDRNPLRADDPDDVRWLRALVWPDEPAREERLAAALASVGRDAPTIFRGDALGDLDRLIEASGSGFETRLRRSSASVPASSVSASVSASSASTGGGSTVIMHSATLAYLTETDRRSFIDRVRESGVHWLSFEGVGVLPEIRAKVPDAESHRDTPHFIVALDGEPLGYCSPHGGWVRWYAHS